MCVGVCCECSLLFVWGEGSDVNACFLMGSKSVYEEESEEEAFEGGGWKKFSWE